ncbi:hypothetical protein [Acidiphilium iwatense]|uniref:Uncharacterized protein n=1 Tax=Acidiphilium iwatense TaxID=768198 RepID=A0ABS9E3N9_9PROT|nr:hypothetical protein [Acidiphilium iwatense]MCF3948536.1 hypothetical protein [Acidiphilium iwatense]
MEQPDKERKIILDEKALASIETTIDCVISLIQSQYGEQYVRAEAERQFHNSLKFDEFNNNLLELLTTVKDQDAKVKGQDAEVNGQDAEVNGQGAEVNGQGADKKLNGLVSAHAMILAKTAEIELLQLRFTMPPTLTSSESPTPPTMALATPGWVSHLLNYLGGIAASIWKIIQSLLTPKSWSIEGGISFPGLVNASLKIEFG